MVDLNQQAPPEKSKTFPIRLEFNTSGTGHKERLYRCFYSLEDVLNFIKEWELEKGVKIKEYLVNKRELGFDAHAEYVHED